MFFHKIWSCLHTIPTPHNVLRNRSFLHAPHRHPDPINLSVIKKRTWGCHAAKALPARRIALPFLCATKHTQAIADSWSSFAHTITLDHMFVQNVYLVFVHIYTHLPVCTKRTQDFSQNKILPLHHPASKKNINITASQEVVKLFYNSFVSCWGQRPMVSWMAKNSFMSCLGQCKQTSVMVRTATVDGQTITILCAADRDTITILCVMLGTSINGRCFKTITKHNNHK